MPISLILGLVHLWTDMSDTDKAEISAKHPEFAEILERLRDCDA